MVVGLTLVAAFAVQVVVPSPAAADVGACAGATLSGDDATRFVTEVYRRLFHRAPDAEGLATWASALGRGAPRSAVSHAITSSEEFRAGLITQAYREYLDRRPDGHGLRGWVGVLGGGATVGQITNGFLASDEYWARAGAAAEGWVRALYRSVLGRGASDQEVTDWAARLRAGATRESIASGFLLSEEHLAAVVDGYYHDLLDRGLDPTGRADWARRLQAGAQEESIIGNIVGSTEFCVAAVRRTWTLTPVLSATEVAAGQPFSVRVLARRPGGAEIDVTDRARAALWGDATGCVGMTCTARLAGPARVDVLFDNVTAQAPVNVLPGPAVALGLDPSSGVQVSYGSPVEMAVVSATDAWGNNAAVPTVPATFTVDGDAGACSGAVCSLGGVGRHEVRATIGGAAGRVLVEVTERGPGHARLVGWGHVAGADLGPTPTPLGGGGDWSWVAAGGSSTSVAGARTDGTLWGWGDVVSGWSAGSAVPVQSAWQRDWVAVVPVGGSYRLGLRSDGTAWMWWGPATTPRERGAGLPWRLGDRSDWVRLFGGDGASAAFLLRADGTLWGVGSNSWGVLGVGEDVAVSWTPVQVGHDADWASVSVGWFHVIATKQDGSLWAWGWNGHGYGALGTGSLGSEIERLPVRVGTANDWVEVDAGTYTSGGVRSDGSLWLWGKTEPSGLGDVAPELRRTVPTPFATGTSWSRVRLGTGTGAAQAVDGTWWTWGANSAGQLGDGTTVGHADARLISGSDRWLDVVLLDERGAIALEQVDG